MDKDKIYRVGEINRLTSRILRDNFSNINIQGEISNLNYKNSAWAFFDLKDNESVIACVNFSGIVFKNKDMLSDGTEIIATGYLSIYEKSGRYQLNISNIELIGEGDIYAKIEELKEKLRLEGLFDKENKKILDFIPKSVGIISSFEKGSMAYKDFTKRLIQRFPLIDIYFYNSKVQGIEASKELIEGIDYFNKREDIDIIVITRGGGSIEDLMPFNDESLARKIYKSPKITVSAIGHEGNTSISDLVADIYAFTPTHAADLISPQKEDLLENINITFLKIQNDLYRNLENKENMIKSEYRNMLQKMDYTIFSSKSLLNNSFITMKNIAIYNIDSKIQYLIEKSFNIKEKNNIKEIKTNLEYKMESILKIFNENTKSLKIDLNNRLKSIKSLSPLNLMDRGYSITFSNGKILKEVQTLKINDIIKTRIKDGEIESKVIKKYE